MRSFGTALLAALPSRCLRLGAVGGRVGIVGREVVRGGVAGLGLASEELLLAESEFGFELGDALVELLLA